jgi:sugar lactone lactonase YvrE
MFDIKRVGNGNAVLGEGPVWDVTEQALFWVDIKAHVIHRLDPRDGSTQSWTAPGQVGCVALDGEGNFIAALQEGIFRINRADSAYGLLVDPESALPTNRFNDGKVDPLGRLWAGTMRDDETWTTEGSLYVLDHAGSCERRLSGLRCPNGLGWSPDGGTMYVTDSMIGTIWAFDFDVAAGTLGTQRVFAQWPMSEGVPDGLAVDAAGDVWSVVWDGGEIRRFAASGHLVQVVQLPVKRPTSCAFGGPGLDTLYVTSASIGLSNPTKHDGGLFAFKPGVNGLPLTRYGIPLINSES